MSDLERNSRGGIAGHLPECTCAFCIRLIAEKQMSDASNGRATADDPNVIIGCTEGCEYAGPHECTRGRFAQSAAPHCLADDPRVWQKTQPPAVPGVEHAWPCADCSTACRVWPHEGAYYCVACQAKRGLEAVHAPDGVFVGYEVLRSASAPPPALHRDGCVCFACSSPTWSTLSVADATRAAEHVQRRVRLFMGRRQGLSHQETEAWLTRLVADALIEGERRSASASPCPHCGRVA